MRSRLVLATGALAIVAVTLLIYAPVYDAGLVWDDKIIFHDNAWLRYGDAWKDYIFRNFFDWVHYFRPLVVALFVAEARGFDASPGPMHVVSLSLHITNVLLVGWLALLLRAAGAERHRFEMPALVAMLVYAVHPAAIEPVVWISSQAELLVTLFLLLALICNTTLRSDTFRAVATSTCFFLAACAKESAISLPLVIALFDWVQPSRSGATNAHLRAVLRRQWRVYVGILIAGIAYLALRAWALGYLVHPLAMQVQPLSSWARLQMVSYTYVTYWRILLWPMYGLGPFHVVDAARFSSMNVASAGADALALAIVAAGAWCMYRRSPWGTLVAAFSIALLPVLHIIPVAFDESLYHERYMMTAAALACALIPQLASSVRIPATRLRAAAAVAGGFFVAWIGLAIVNIRVTLPLWSDETKLWLWELGKNPDSVTALHHLLTTYMELGDRTRADEMATRLIAKKAPCAMCMVNIANLAIWEGDATRAALALDEARGLVARQQNQRTVEGFILATGGLREINGDAAGAEEAYRDVAKMDPLDPDARFALALLLARQHRTTEARAAFAEALSLLAPDQRPQKRATFDATLQDAARRAPPD